MGMPTVEIDWMRGFSNSPRVILKGIKVPEYPSKTDPLWEKLENGIHVARKGDFVFYFYTDGNPTDGFAGRVFEGTFKDGSTFKYKGAWSSRAGCVNRVYRDQIVDVVVGHIATAVTLEFLDRIWNLPNVALVRRECGNDITYEPTYNGMFKGEPGFEYPPL